MQQTPEPLAKFHAKVDKSGRIIIPKYIRDTYGIKPNDFVVLIIRKVSIDKKNRKVYVHSQFKFSGKVNERGVVVIPKQYRSRFTIEPGELVEVLLMDYHEPEETTPPTTYTYVFL